MTGLDVSGPLLASRVYETEPVGTGPGAGAFLNAVIEIETSLPPHALLDGLQSIEAAMGRPSKRPRNAPRTIDLDILYAGNLILSNAEVVIPQPGLYVAQPDASNALLLVPPTLQGVYQVRWRQSWRTTPGMFTAWVR